MARAERRAGKQTHVSEPANSAPVSANLRAVQILLGHSKTENTVRYWGWNSKTRSPWVKPMKSGYQAGAHIVRAPAGFGRKQTLAQVRAWRLRLLLVRRSLRAHLRP